MKALAATVAAGLVLAAPAPPGALAYAGAAQRPPRPAAATAAPAPALRHAGASRAGLPGVLRCRVLSAHALRCRAAPSSARGVLYVLFGEWRHRGAPDARIVLVHPPPPTAGGQLRMIASGRLGALACAAATARARTCTPMVLRSSLPAGDLGIYVRRQF